VRVTYADPPYIGMAKLYKGHSDYAGEVDHADLIQRRLAEFDSWALSLHTPSLKTILPLCPDDVRVMAWVKPFCSFKPGVRLAYAWEPVIIRNPRKGKRGDLTTRDWCAANIALRKGLPRSEAGSFLCLDLRGDGVDTRRRLP